MANALGELFGDIASAIREKTGDAEKMKPAQFPEKISEIETGADVSGVTATAPHVLAGDVFVDAQGNPVEGTMRIISPAHTTMRYYENVESYKYPIPEGYHDGTGIVEVGYEPEKIVTPAKHRNYVYGTPYGNASGWTGYNFLSMVTVEPIPKEYQDVTPVTATAEDVRAGKVFVDAQGNAVEGALSGTIADVSGVTATAADVRQGKIIVDAQGNEVVGTLVVEQKAPDVIWVGKDSVSNALVGTGVIRYVTFCNHDGTETYGQKSVIAGENCVDPVAAGHMDAPTRESTAQYNYTFSGGWATEPGGGINADALKNVTEDRTVYANFIAAVRYYTVSFYDGETLVHTESVPYGGSSTYVYNKENTAFMGWNPEPVNITGDLNCYGSWVESYSFADASWEYISQISESGMASKIFALGDTKQISYKYNGTDYTATVEIVDFNYDDKADGSGKAGITVCMTDVTPWIVEKHRNDVNPGCQWPNCDLRTLVNTTIYNTFEDALKKAIKPVTKVTNGYSGTAATAFTSTDNVWIPSLGEVYRYNVTNYSLVRENVNIFAKFTRKKSAAYWLRTGCNTNIGNSAVSSGSVMSINVLGSNKVVFGFCI